MPESSPNPARLTKTETRHALSAFNLAVGLRSVFDTVCGGTTFVFVGFALSLGLANERMGFITSILSFACLLQMLTLVLLGRIRDRKRFIIGLGVAEPLLLIVTVLALPFLPPAMRLPGLAVAAFVAAALLHLTRPLADDWLAVTIPAELRGRYLGRRFQASHVCMIATTLVAGWVVERHVHGSTRGLALVLAAGGVFGVLAVLALRPVTMPGTTAATAIAAADLRGIWSHRPFRHYLLAVFLFNLPFYFACPYYQVFQLRVLNMGESLIGYMQCGYMLVKIAVLPLAGRLAERVGPRRVALVCGVLYTLFFLIYPLSSAGHVWPAVAAWLLAAIPDGLYNVALMAAMFQAIPENSPSRPAFFAVSNLVTLVFYGLGAQIAVLILEGIKTVTVTVGPFSFGHFHLYYLGCAALMAVAQFAAFWFADRPRPVGGAVP
ncbi:MAG: hypothetical protein A3K19_28075 [Lentisphaerae bacterium RIFOXYB12_FULL_65_16]|nr:MAG: hypothetical protein A3K18_27850 [Lentisphaerae bacterium RIFOXYA12_64_32]OGV88149.1 MAG: hypothetical protein A3K19_28075 [Lentisphaerae bacterium RIFOXYB12_FULL_65_16]